MIGSLLKIHEYSVCHSSHDNQREICSKPLCKCRHMNGRLRSRNTTLVEVLQVGEKTYMKKQKDVVDRSLEMHKSLIERAKDVLNIAEVKKTITIGTKLFEAISPVISEPTLWNGIKSAFAVGQVFVEDVEVWSDDYFNGDEWSLPYTRDFNAIVLRSISKYPYKTIRSTDDNYVIRLVDLEGIKCGYTLNTKLNTIQSVYVDTGRLDEARDIIKRLLWQQFKDSSIVMRQNKRIAANEDWNEGEVCFEPDDVIESKQSARATEYSTYLKKCIDAGVARSVMLYGPPGTGKSTMARTIVNMLNMRSFRIRVEDVNNLSNSTLFEAINIFQPDAIVLDDFDRSGSQAQLLETLEFFQRHVKLVIATVNDRNSLDEAILRPGRFDELVCIKQMDADVVRSVLGPEMQDAFDLVKDWPVAFIQEYAKRRRFMTKEEAIQSTEELVARVKRLERYEDVNDTERMIKLMQKKGLSTNNGDAPSSQQVEDDESDDPFVD